MPGTSLRPLAPWQAAQSDAKRCAYSAFAAVADAAKMARGKELAQQHKCVFCHGVDLAGGQQVPRIGGQREEYVRDALHGFKTGKRPGYTQAMTEAVSQIPPEDLDTLAYYAARFTAPAATGK